MSSSLNSRFPRGLKSTLAVFIFLWCSTSLQGQSLYTPEGEHTVAVGIGLPRADFLSGAYEIKASISKKGRWDLGASFSRYSISLDRFTQFESQQFFTPQVGYLWVKGKKGFNLSTTAGAHIGMGENSETGFSYNVLVGQRFGKINNTHVLPYISMNRTNLTNEDNLGAGVSLNMTTPENGTDIASIDLGISSLSSGRIFTISFTWIITQIKDLEPLTDGG